MSLRETHESTEAKTACKVKSILERLDGDDRAWLLEVISDPSEAITGISRTLTRGGYTVSNATMYRHRNHECGCGDAA